MANIAVIVPVFNEETVLEKSVLSLLTQSYPATELILVDDGSTDRSVEIANELAQRFPSVHSIQTTAKGRIKSVKTRLTNPWLSSCARWSFSKAR